MKKTLLIIMTVAFCASLMAQQAQRITHESLKAISVEKKFLAGDSRENDKTFTPNFTPKLRNSPLLRSNEPYHWIGGTHYNTPSNNNSRNTCSFRSDSKNAAAVWTMSTDNSPTRGTGINYYDVDNNSWRVIPDLEGRIETVRTGWGGHAFTKEGEVVIAHDGAAALVVNTRDTWGEDEWTQTILKGPNYTLKNGANYVNTTALLWPTMITNENTVHLVAVTEQWVVPPYYREENYPDIVDGKMNGYKGYPTYPLYYRSPDGGKTWGDPVDFMENGLLTSYEIMKISADDYVMAAKGDHIVILFNCWGFVIYLESKDDGVTWTKHDVYHPGEILHFSAETQPMFFPDAAAVTIDDAGKVHVIFGAMPYMLKKDDYSVSYWPISTGMVYWNNVINDDPINVEDFTGEAVPSGDNYTLKGDFWTGKPGYLPLPSVTGFDDFFYWMAGPEWDVNQYKGASFATQQRLLAKDGKVYAAYQSTVEYPINFVIDGTAFLARAIFVTVSEDNGKTWDVAKNTSWISYTPELLWVDWSDYTEDAWPIVINDTLYVATNIHELLRVQNVTENAYPSLSFNTAEDMFILQWYSYPYPWPTADQGPFMDEPFEVVTFAKNLSELPAYKNISEIYKNMWSDAPVIECISDDINDRSLIVTFRLPFYQRSPIVGFNLYRDGDSTAIAEMIYDHYNPVCLCFKITEELEVDTDYVYQVSAIYNVDDEDLVESSWSCAVHYKLGDNIVPCEPDGDGVKNTPVAPNVKLYPNPANGNVWIKVDANSPYTVTVTNIMGQVLTTMNGNTDKVSLNVSNYAPGVYIVNVRTAGAMTSQKLIVR